MGQLLGGRCELTVPLALERHGPWEPVDRQVGRWVPVGGRLRPGRGRGHADGT